MADKDSVEIHPMNGISNQKEDTAVDYDVILRKFGLKRIDEKLLALFEEVTGKKPHIWLTRGVYFCHRDLDLILRNHQKKLPMFLYTGRGPSGNMHLGHLLPFMFTKHLQDVFDCPLVIQMTDDEKYLLNNVPLEDIAVYREDNVRNIIACGFDPEKTFIFNDLDYMGKLYPTVVKISKSLTFNQIKSCFGFSESDCIGKWAFPPTQMAPSFCASFPGILTPIATPDDKNESKKKKKKKKKKRKRKKDVVGRMCLIPHAIDQDPYFRLTRDVAHKLGYQKPTSICCKFLPGLKGPGSKMSTSIPDSAIFLDDSAKKIKKKIGRCFSGGGKDLEAQRKNGADLSKDVAYRYLSFFLEDEEQLKEIGEKYSKGEMLTGEVKKVLIGVMQKMLKDFQDRRAKVTDEVVKKFMDHRLLKDHLFKMEEKEKESTE